MKILKIEDHNYKIIYINDNEVYNAYRRLSSTEWEKYSVNRERWYTIEDEIETQKLEKAYENSSIG
jgi:uncharacterized protein YlbG (UPF0298 family)